MRFLPHSEADIRAMLTAIGVADIDALFADIPAALRQEDLLAMPPALDEQRLVAHLQALAAANRSEEIQASFLGAGVYAHYTPRLIEQLLNRSEFLTAYTPYQPELAQGTLKAIFEFQSMMTELLGMEVANASMYDGAHACTEAVLMALRLRPKATRVWISAALHPEYKSVLATYLAHSPVRIEEVPLRDGRTDYAALDGNDAAILVVQSPNFLGIIEDLQAAGAACQRLGTLFGVTFCEALAYGILQPPGAFGADIVAGEGQSLGLAPSFGGPLLGVFASREQHLRAMPGRLVSQTTDVHGREAYVLTLATREQHIRRARATSNICTNQGLMALAATIYLSLVGKGGLQTLARINFSRAEYAKSQLSALPGVSLPYASPTFNEFVIRLPGLAQDWVHFGAERGLAVGVPLSRFGSHPAEDLLVTVTEMCSAAQIDLLVATLREWLQAQR